MKAMILAAGKGTRVQPLTYELPKPMIPILGKPVLEYLVEHLVSYGVREIMINVSYLHHQIEAYFGDGHRFGAQIGYSFEGYRNGEGELFPEPIGSAGGMKKIHDFGGFFDETTLVICGDAIINLNLTAALSEHRSKGASASLITKNVPREKSSEYGMVVSDHTGRITSFQEKPAPFEARSTHASTGIYIFEPEIIKLIPSGRSFDIGSELFPLLIERGVAFYALNHPFNWIDIGNVKDFWSVSQQVMRGEIAHMSIPGKEILPGVWVGLNVRIDWTGTEIIGPVHIGSGSKIEAGSTIIGPTWIGHGSHICANSSLAQCILFDYTRILPGIHMSEMVVCKDYCVNREGTMMHLDESPDDRWSDSRDRRARARYG